MPARFDADYRDPQLDFEPLVAEVFDELQSNFLEMPRGPGFTDYATWERGYQVLKRCTRGFAMVTQKSVLQAVAEAPISFVVLRSMLGLTAPEWAHIATEMTGVQVNQNAARSLDRKLRLLGLKPQAIDSGVTGQRLAALVKAGVQVLRKGAGKKSTSLIHRLDKMDTEHGLSSLRNAADLGAPYAMLLYERFLGRPFASHRDSVSERVGEVVESAIKDVLTAAKVTFRETKRAERIAGFDQAPDFMIPDEFAPVALIEAKLSEDDGTARDKVARVQRLRALRDQAGKDYDVIACISGRGFKVRPQDMRRLLQATDGKVFTLKSMDLLIANTRIRQYRSR